MGCCQKELSPSTLRLAVQTAHILHGEANSPAQLALLWKRTGSTRGSTLAGGMHAQIAAAYYTAHVFRAAQVTLYRTFKYEREMRYPDSAKLQITHSTAVTAPLTT